MKICFLDNSPIPYTTNDLNSKAIRGAENVVIHLSNELTKLNNKVVVFNNSLENKTINDVKWSNLNNINRNITYDLAFTNNDMKLFDKLLLINMLHFHTVFKL